MGLVEDDQVVGLDARFLKPGEHAVAGQGVDADDEAVARRPDEGIAGSGVAAADDVELKAEQLRQLALPVPDQPGWRDDQDALEQPAREHLADVEAGHDRLARAGVVGEQEPQAGLLQHVVVDGDPLVRQRVDLAISVAKAGLDR